MKNFLKSCAFTGLFLYFWVSYKDYSLRKETIKTIGKLGKYQPKKEETNVNA